jgi:hypothetical protein
VADARERVGRLSISVSIYKKEVNIFRRCSMLRSPIRSMGTMILIVMFWILLGSNAVSGVGIAQELEDKVKIIEVNYKIDSRDEDSVSLVPLLALYHQKTLTRSRPSWKARPTGLIFLFLIRCAIWSQVYPIHARSCNNP